MAEPVAVIEAGPLLLKLGGPRQWARSQNPNRSWPVRVVPTS